ncbi:P-loop ATPase, Sll1717 family [Streptomyces sp. NPDC006925]|uniref:P-loop ATPase, Sll1717 family n=1 Tax=Streptomyces sp. NPDC006925 TaxID=3364768 RepID=UPI0036AAA35B
MLRISEADNFGAIDADADELLRECFQSHPAYIAARDNKKFLILGRKGSGKTAIFKRFLTDRNPYEFAYGHSFDDYPWQHHDLQAQTGVPEERRYFHSWKYLTLMGLAKILLNVDQSQPWSDDSFDAVQALEDFVVDSYGSRDPDVRQLFSPSKELRFKGTLKIPYFEFSGERVRIKDLPPHIQEVNRVIQEHVLRALNPDHSYYICFDQLDLGFTKEDVAYSHRLIGLILAARDLFLAARNKGKKLNIVVFLRDDIYQDLQFEDKNKITENFSELVAWSEFGDGLSLKMLMESRFSRVLGDADDLHVPWDSVFDETREMPSRQSKYKHICDRTFLRPRDIIKFCNEILRQYKAPLFDAGSQFDNQVVHEARSGYSDYLLNELDDEIAKHVPKYKEYLEVLKEIGSVHFPLEDFANSFERRESLAGIDPVSALGQLFEFSIVGYLKPGGRGGGSEYVWRYRDPRARFNTSAEVFRVHPGFKEALDLLSRQIS